MPIQFWNFSLSKLDMFPHLHPALLTVTHNQITWHQCNQCFYFNNFCKNFPLQNQKLYITKTRISHYKPINFTLQTHKHHITKQKTSQNQNLTLENEQLHITKPKLLITKTSHYKDKNFTLQNQNITLKKQKTSHDKARIPSWKNSCESIMQMIVLRSWTCI